MGPEELPADVQQFLLDHVEGYEHLEVLFMLRRHAERSFSYEQICGATGLRADVVASALDSLRESGIVETAGGASEWRYHPPEPRLDELVERVARAYRERPIEVVRVMNANAIERVRTSAMRTFAQAFVLRGGKKNG